MFTIPDMMFIIYSNKSFKEKEMSDGFRIKLVREAGFEPAPTGCGLDPESSESANSTTLACEQIIFY